MDTRNLQNNHYLHHRDQTQNPTKAKQEPVKIKYISSPTFVRASNPIEFRAIVQELTGQNSEDRTSSDSYTMITNHGNLHKEMGTENADGGLSSTMRFS
ncbi:hypothetical protein CJ030_MR0G006185 [Morella rubra]|uniref:VQ domain-containing protein n=1 Tax=Morella rubra TaxID=262757 RepID=A0A6A1UKY6_9ROSI|nr:hypothetical protein CJ030_MR0G006185 [Morella rubra]